MQQFKNPKGEQDQVSFKVLPCCRWTGSVISQQDTHPEEQVQRVQQTAQTLHCVFPRHPIRCRPGSAGPRESGHYVAEGGAEPVSASVLVQTRQERQWWDVNTLRSLHCHPEWDVYPAGSEHVRAETGPPLWFFWFLHTPPPIFPVVTVKKGRRHVSSLGRNTAVCVCSI